MKKADLRSAIKRARLAVKQTAVELRALEEKLFRQAARAIYLSNKLTGKNQHAKGKTT
jgi:hypothetical protein